MSRVDGAVVLRPDLTVLGYGAEITAKKPPKRVFAATNARAAQRDLKRIDYEDFGTRHRSAMRYVLAVPGAIAFVVSQDGDVRAIANIGGDSVVVWENLKLGLEEYIRARR